MPKVSTLFPSPILRAPDLGGAQPAHILGYREEFANGASFYVLDVDVRGERSVLRLGVTLARDIKAVLNEDDLDKWPGHAISIFPSQMKIKDRDSGEDKVVDVIRASAAPAGVTPSKMALTRPTLNDDIPF